MFSSHPIFAAKIVQRHYLFGRKLLNSKSILYIEMNPPNKYYMNVTHEKYQTKDTPILFRVLMYYNFAVCLV